MRTRLKPGDMGVEGGDLRGYKADSLALRENGLRIVFRGGVKPWSMDLRGIIAFRDSGLIGRPLGGYAIEDRGSYKVLRILRAHLPGRSGGTLLYCEYLEGSLGAGAAVP